MKKPKISIITITYNSEKTVRDTFNSIRKQHYENLEYIVIDGGSTDTTLQIADENKDIISVLVSEPDKGISDAMNKGIQRATGDLIGIIHSDDMLTEHALDRLVEEWDDVHDVFYGNCVVCSEEGKPMHILNAEKDLSGFRYGLVLVHPSTFVTKTAYEKYGLFDVTLKCAMDYDLLARFYFGGARFKYIDSALAIYRVGGTNMKFRKRTIAEVRDISIRLGANPLKAHLIAWKKRLIDLIKPIVKPVFNLLKIHSHRVKSMDEQAS